MQSTERVWLRRVALTLSIMLAANLAAPRFAIAQCTNVNAPETVSWVNGLISAAIGEDNACRAGSPDRDNFATSSACNIFVGRVMARMYGITDFVSSSDHSFLKANAIAALLPTWRDWVDIGTAGDQEALAAAADGAKLGYIILAVWANPVSSKPGHIVLIGPGPLTPSAAWGLQTPVAASFKLDDPEHAFVGQPLACAFGANKKNTTHLWKHTKLLAPR